MHLLDFINTYSDWKSRLSNPPYNIKIKKDGNYFLFKYNQISSDMSLTEVQESRGSIFYRSILGKYIYVCRPFNKFFNYGESHAADIDWENCWVSEKIDGSLMKMWYFDGAWHLSTNSTIDAFKAYVADTGISFGEIFERILTAPIETFGEYLNKRYTYLFEMTSPETKIVIPYNDNIYFLTSFETTTGKESTFFDRDLLIKRTKRFVVKDLAKLIDLASTLDKNHEGFVVADIHSNRIKVKGQEYLIAAHLNNNGCITKKRAIKWILEDKIDDVIAYCPEYKNFIKDVEYHMAIYGGYLENLKTMSEPFREMSRASYAAMIKNYPEKPFLFKCYDNKDFSAIEYIKQLPIQKLADKIYQK